MYCPEPRTFRLTIRAEYPLVGSATQSHRRHWTVRESFFSDVPGQTFCKRTGLWHLFYTSLNPGDEIDTIKGNWSFPCTGRWDDIFDGDVIEIFLRE